MVKNSRSTLGMTQEEYARLFGDRSPSISRLEKADYIELPNHNTLEKLSEILRIPYWELIEHLLAEENKSIESVSLNEEQIVAGIKQQFDLKSLLNVNWELTVQIERCRNLPSAETKPLDNGNSRNRNQLY